MRFIILSAALMLVAVLLGALGAHALRPALEGAGKVDVWETAVLYHFTHGLALLGIGIWQTCDGRAQQSRSVHAAAWLWVGGMALFCGSLYGLSLDGPAWLGPVTPVGGVSFLSGWVALGLGATRLARERPSG